MARDDRFADMKAALLDKGLELGRTIRDKVAKPLGDKFAAKVSKAAMEKGALDRPLTFDEMMALLKRMHAEGKLNPAEFAKHKDEILKTFGKK